MPSLLIAVDDCGHERNFDTDTRQIFNRSQLHIKEVPDTAMLVLFFADSVELQINAMLAGSFCGFAEFQIFRIANTVRGRKNSVETNLARVINGFEEVRRKRRLAAGEKNNHLALWFEGDSAIKNRFRIFERRLVNIANLICIHEAGIAHHVAAISQVYGQHGAATKFNIGSSVTMNCGILGRAKISSKEQRFDSFEKSRIRGHHVIKLPVLGTSLTHDHLTVFFQDLSFDFARMLMHQGLEGRLAGNHGVSDFFNAGWTEAICLARKAEWRRTSFVRLQKRTGSPGGADRFAFRQASVDGLKSLPSHTRKIRKELGASDTGQFALLRFSPAKLVTEQSCLSPHRRSSKRASTKLKPC